MARLTSLPDSDDIKPDLVDAQKPSKSAKEKRKRSPFPVDSDDDDVSTPSPQPKEKKPRIKKEAKTKSSAWSKAQVRQLWDALDMKPGRINWDHVAGQVDGRGKIACRDKWLKMIRPRLEEFIDSLGE